ncbi:hypothetical protein LJB42_000404 [Komagataella kurtzmanii]|nr:hypothetical protein LJB42_000404 [Komagataella kurtzmanii]
MSNKNVDTAPDNGSGGSNSPASVPHYPQQHRANYNPHKNHTNHGGNNGGAQGYMQHQQQQQMYYNQMGYPMPYPNAGGNFNQNVYLVPYNTMVPGTPYGAGAPGVPPSYPVSPSAAFASPQKTHVPVSLRTPSGEPINLVPAGQTSSSSSNASPHVKSTSIPPSAVTSPAASIAPTVASPTKAAAGSEDAGKTRDAFKQMVQALAAKKKAAAAAKAEVKTDDKKESVEFKAKSAVQPETKPKVEVKLEPKPKVEVKLEPKPKVEIKLEPKSVSEAKPETKTVPEVEEPSTVATIKSESTPIEELKPKVEVTPEVASESAQEPANDVKISDVSAKEVQETKEETLKQPKEALNDIKSTEESNKKSSPPEEESNDHQTLFQSQGVKDTEQSQESEEPKGIQETQETQETAKPLEAQAPQETQETQESQEVQEQTPETSETVSSVTEEVSPAPAPGFPLSKFLDRIRKSPAISNPFKHEYSGDFHGPDESLSDLKTIKYDPGFLIQFATLNFHIDEDFINDVGSKVVIPVNTRRDNFSKSMSTNNFKGSGRNMGSNFRNDFGSRNNSKQGSKKKNKSQKSQSRRGPKYSNEEEPAEPAVPAELPNRAASKWVPRSLRNKEAEVKTAPDGSIIVSEEDIKRKTKSLLNKLTLEFFDDISSDIIALTKQAQWEDDVKTLKQVIESIFAKACDEPYWSSMYAKLCAKMCKDTPPEIKETNEKGNTFTGGDLVRRVLINRCQTEYQKGWIDQLPTNEDGSPLEPELMSDEYYKQAAAKRRGLGLVKFIGQLYQLNLLSDNVIFHCVLGQSKETDNPSEDTMENLVQLLEAVGYRMEMSSEPKIRRVLDLAFANIKAIVDANKIPSRIRFMLMDLMDLRRNGWATTEENAGPKTIQEIHLEAEIKRSEEEREKERDRHSRRGRYNDSKPNSRQKSSWGSSVVSPNDIRNAGYVRNSDKSLGPVNSFSRGKSSRQASKQSNSDFTSVPITSSSGSRTALNHSGDSSTSLNEPQSREYSKKSESRPAPSNIFAALEDHDHDHEHGHEQEENKHSKDLQNGEAEAPEDNNVGEIAQADENVQGQEQEEEREEEREQEEEQEV